MSKLFDTLSRTSLTLLVSAVVAVSAAPAYSQKLDHPESETKTLRFGVYDPYGTFANDPTIGIEHVYMPWQDSDLSSLKSVDAYSSDRHRSVLITVEPWSWSRPVGTPEELFQAISAGKYDGLIAQFCTAAGALKSDVTLRWGHEMDLANKRFPWSEWQPAQFVSAYRHFVDTCRASAAHVKFMWSPRGESNLQAYYPGDAYVDNIGLTMFGYQEYEVGVYGKALTLSERLGPSYELVKAYDKDLYITEFGCHGDAGYVQSCREEVKAVPAQFPQLVAVVYFNEVETFPWPEPYGLPDWRIFSSTVAQAEK